MDSTPSSQPDSSDPISKSRMVHDTYELSGFTALPSRYSVYRQRSPPPGSTLQRSMPVSTRMAGYGGAFEPSAVKSKLNTTVSPAETVIAPAQADAGPNVRSVATIAKMKP